MNRKQKKELRQRQSTRQLMGIVRVTPHGIVTDFGERVGMPTVNWTALFGLVNAVGIFFYPDVV